LYWHSLFVAFGPRLNQLYEIYPQPFICLLFSCYFLHTLEASDYEQRALQNASWVAKKIETVRRRTDLSYSHHLEVASLHVNSTNIFNKSSFHSYFIVIYYFSTKLLYLIFT